MVVNITALSNITGFYSAGNAAMIVTNNMLFVGLITAIYIIALMKLAPKYDFASVMAVSSFACFALSLPLVYLNWINIFFPIFFLLATAGSLFYIRMTSQ